MLVKQSVHWTAYVSPGGYAWQSKPITRGYTGHEQLDPVGLVHMNGRVYDPELGRFLSPDAVIQDVSNLQTINAYSYVLNNPLSLTDPTGFFFQGLFRAIGGAFKAVFRAMRAAFRAVLRSAIGRAILQIIACIPSPVSAATCAGASAAMTLATGGSVVDAIKSAAFAFVQTYAFAYVGSYLRDVGLAGNYLAKGLVHGVVGGAMSMAQGGGFVQGFAGSAIGAVGGMVAGESGLVGSYGDGISELQLARAAISAAAGCAASAATGGKCAPAAVTAAFASIYNGDRGAFLGAYAGAYGGALAGGSLTAVCAFFTGGGCATAGPYIVTGGAMIGRAVGGALGSGIEDWVFSDGDPPTTDDLIKDAQARYPNKAGKFEDHHEDPKYMGGDPKGPTRRIDAAYHQDITNEFRRHHGYGLGNLPEAQRKLIMDEVYKKFPLP